MLLDLARDRLGYSVGLLQERAERSSGRLPAIEAANPPVVGYRDNQLDRHAPETALIRPDLYLGQRAHTERLPADQSFAVALKEGSQEFRLTPRLSNGRSHAGLFAAIDTAPLITAGAIGPDSYLLGYRFALDDEHPPAMYDKVIDLAYAGGTVLLRLLPIRNP